MLITKLIKLYCDICYYCQYSIVASEAQRLSNNCRPKFTDEECITIYIWGILNGQLTNKAIWAFTKNYWYDWFPEMPKYKAFNYRLNALAPVFQALFEVMIATRSTLRFCAGIPEGLLDSMPVIVAKAARSGSAKAAGEICNKGYCASKKEYYYGVKLHFLGIRQSGTLPAPESLRLSSASEFDLTVAKEWLMNFRNMTLFCDKAYIDESWKAVLDEFQNIQVITPKKRAKGQEFLESADALLSTLVSRIRQPIESLFNWLQEKTKIQCASKIRSTTGLLAHVFGRLTAAFWSAV